jgi:hypothetical protein
MTTVPAFVVVMGVWVVGTLAAGAFFFGSNDATAKRRWYPTCLVGYSLGFVLWIGLATNLEVALICTPFAGLIGWSYWRQMRFCESCGGTEFEIEPFRRPQACRRCGKPLIRASGHLAGR